MRRGYRRPPFLTIGVCCSWLHSANCKLSIVVLVSAFFYLWLTLAHFCRYLYVLDVCCQFASCQAMLAICKSYCKISPKCIKNNAQIDTNSSKIRPKSTKMVPRRVPKAILRASRFHVLPPKKFLVPFWSNLGDVARHFVPSWAPRGSQNQAFWHQVALKSQKMTSWMRH